MRKGFGMGLQSDLMSCIRLFDWGCAQTTDYDPPKSHSRLSVLCWEMKVSFLDGDLHTSSGAPPNWIWGPNSRNKCGDWSPLWPPSNLVNWLVRVSSPYLGLGVFWQTKWHTVCVAGHMPLLSGNAINVCPICIPGSAPLLHMASPRLIQGCVGCD